MRMEIKNENEVFFFPSGRIDISNSEDLKKQLLAAYRQGFDYVKIDFSEVTGIDSSGLGKLLLFQKKLKERGGELSIVNIKNDYLKKMFSMIQLYKVIHIEDITGKDMP